MCNGQQLLLQPMASSPRIEHQLLLLWPLASRRGILLTPRHQLAVPELAVCTQPDCYNSSWQAGWGASQPRLALLVPWAL